MHPMRKSHRRVSDAGEVERILLNAEFMTLTINDGGNAPYAVPLNFGYRDSVLYFHCAREGRKIDLLRADPSVGFCAVGRCELHGLDAPDGCKATSSFESVVGAGVARIIEDRDTKLEGLAVIMAHYSERKYEFKDKIVDETTVVAIDVDWMDGKRNDKRPGAADGL